MLAPRSRLLAIANRLAKIERGSGVADSTIHEALGRAGPVEPYTTNDDAARTLLPDGYEWCAPIYSAAVVYAACRPAGLDANGESHPHTGQWGRTLALAMAGTAVRAHFRVAGSVD